VNHEPTCDSDDYARSMRDPGLRERRRAMLPNIERLTDYVADLRRRNLGEVPDFDPCGGGIGARVLFLFEKPGPKAAESGFISRNNDDSTAAAIFNFMQEAGIPRRLTVIWNLVPWWNGTRKITPEEPLNGAACLEELIGLLPALCAVVMVGRKAAKAEPFLKTTGLELFTSWHPSPVVRATRPDRWKAIPSEWAEVLPCIGKPHTNAPARLPLPRPTSP
jgi:uracil-DNA glycosylase